MIYLATNTKGQAQYKALRHYFETHFCSEHDVLILVGDSGMITSESDSRLDDYNFFDFPKILLLSGKDEDEIWLRQFPETTIFGAKGHYLSRNVYHILPGEIVKTHDLRILCLGGETIFKEVNKKASNARVDIVLSYLDPSAFSRRQDEDTEWYYATGKDKQKGGKKLTSIVLPLSWSYIGKGDVKGHCFTSGRDESGYLYSPEIGTTTKLKVGDLPEWFFHDESGYGDSYYDVKDIKDIAFEGPPFDNHIDKDSSIYVAFDKVHPKNEDLSPKRREDYAYGTWRVSLLSFLAAIEKYSPKINLDGVKAQINLAYDQYAGEPMNYHNGHVTTRPFPEVQTPRYYERFSHKPAQYYVIHGEKILASFVELEIAQEYIKKYLTGNLRLENPKPLPVNNDEVERYEDSSGISVSLNQYKEEL